MSEQKPGFDFAGFYAEDAEWIEYKPSVPPHIAELMVSLEKGELEISHEVLGKGRPSFSVDVTLHDGRRVFEHTVFRVEDGRIAHRVDVEAWD